MGGGKGKEVGRSVPLCAMNNTFLSGFMWGEVNDWEGEKVVNCRCWISSSSSSQHDLDRGFRRSQRWQVSRSGHGSMVWKKRGLLGQ